MGDNKEVPRGTRVVHYVELFTPGSLYDEIQCREIARRDPALVDPPPGAYAFQIYDVEIEGATTDSGHRFEVYSKALRRSGRYYLPGAKAYTRDEVNALPGDHEILASNMRCNGWSKVVRTRCGNWQPLEDSDVIMEAPRG